MTYMGVKSKKEWICVYIYIYMQLIHFALQQKLTQLCKSTLLTKVLSKTNKYVYPIFELHEKTLSVNWPWLLRSRTAKGTFVLLSEMGCLNFNVSFTPSQLASLRQVTQPPWINCLHHMKIAMVLPHQLSERVYVKYLAHGQGSMLVIIMSCTSHICLIIGFSLVNDVCVCVHARIGRCSSRQGRHENIHTGCFYHKWCVPGEHNIHFADGISWWM